MNRKMKYVCVKLNKHHTNSIIMWQPSITILTNEDYGCKRETCFTKQKKTNGTSVARKTHDFFQTADKCFTNYLTEFRRYQ